MNAPASGTDLEKLVFFDERAAVLYVSKQHSFHASVCSYVRLLRAKVAKFEVVDVSMDDIQRKLDKKDDESNRDLGLSEMQAIAVNLFRRATERKASDIHIRVQNKGTTKIFIRVNNDLELLEQHPGAMGQLLCSSIYTSMAGISAATFEVLKRQDGRISERDNLPAGLDGIRIATTPQVDGMLMVLRLLYQDETVATDLAALGYPENQRELIAFMKSRPEGINIIAGPTGSGKSTTLQRVLLSIQQESRGAKHIITVEDPPEYPMPGIVQTPVANVSSSEERSEAFQNAIKSTMRLDPDVIMIGEVRDPPSAKLAFEAAMTGHQVWTTVHANNVFAIFDRLIGLGIPPNLMADPSIVKGLICQRLVKVICPHCRIRIQDVWDRYSDAQQRRVMGLGSCEDVHVAGPGCEHCENTGVIGRTVVPEIIVPDQKLMMHIRRGDRDRAYSYWKETGGKTMLDVAKEKIVAGLVDPFQAELVVGYLDAGLELDPALLEQA